MPTTPLAIIVLAAALSAGFGPAGPKAQQAEAAANDSVPVSAAVYAPGAAAVDPPAEPKRSRGPAALAFDELQQATADVTGDGKPDTIRLLGHKREAGSPYYEKLAVAVDDPANKTVLLFRSDGGYTPQLSLCDVNGDKAPEMLVSASTGGSGGTSNYYLYSAGGGKPVVMPTPKPLTLTGSFENGYKAKITVQNTGKTYTIDLKDRKRIYEENGVYKKGRLVKPVDVTVNDYGELKFVDLDKDGVCELAGIQRITGVANADTIAYAHSVWKWTGGEWALVSADVVKAK